MSRTGSAIFLLALFAVTSGQVVNYLVYLTDSPIPFGYRSHTFRFARTNGVLKNIFDPNFRDQRVEFAVKVGKVASTLVVNLSPLRRFFKGIKRMRIGTGYILPTNLKITEPETREVRVYNVWVEEEKTAATAPAPAPAPVPTSTVGPVPTVEHGHTISLKEAMDLAFIELSPDFIIDDTLTLKLINLPEDLEQPELSYEEKKKLGAAGGFGKFYLDFYPVNAFFQGLNNFFLAGLSLFMAPLRWTFGLGQYIPYYAVPDDEGNIESQLATAFGIDTISLDRPTIKPKTIGANDKFEELVTVEANSTQVTYTA